MTILSQLLTPVQFKLIEKLGLQTQIENILTKLKSKEIDPAEASNRILEIISQRENQQIKPAKFVIDLHLGGEDHIDVHHKNEILQSKSLGFDLSRAWVHNKFVLVDGKKMSKSVGNVFLVNGKYSDTGFYSFENPPIEQFSEELKAQISKKYVELKLISKTSEMDWTSFKFDPLAYRLLMFEHHYTVQLDFTWEKLWQSQMRLWGIRKEMAKLQSFIWFSNGEEIHDIDVYEEIKNEWVKILTDNLNIPKFLTAYQDFIDKTMKIASENNDLLHTYYGLVNDFDSEFLQLNLNPLEGLRYSILGTFDDIMVDKSESETLSAYKKVWKLAVSRYATKEAKDYQKSDEIRSEIQKLGWQIDDHAWGFGLWQRGC